MKRTFAAICLLSTSLAYCSAPAFAENRLVEETVQQNQETKININTADIDILTQIPGIGKSKAKAIIEYRKDMGDYQSIEELIQVKGIGEKAMTKIRQFVTI